MKFNYEDSFNMGLGIGFGIIAGIIGAILCLALIYVIYVVIVIAIALLVLYWSELIEILSLVVGLGIAYLIYIFFLDKLKNIGKLETKITEKDFLDNINQMLS